MQLFGSKLNRTIFSVLVNFQDKNSRGDILGSERYITEKKERANSPISPKIYTVRTTRNNNLEFINIQTFRTPNFSDTMFQL